MTNDKLKRQRESRALNGNMHTKKYERTRKGKLMRTYRNMYTRVSGILKTKAHLYEGLDILARGDFYSWSLADKDYNSLFDSWVDSGYEMRLSPSIDRKDTSVGYTPNNIQWTTHSENSRRGSLNRGVSHD